MAHLGTLFVVATPIGNLEDITLRALRVLREADLVAAEDTRRTAGLLRHYAIRSKLTSLHEHNERRRVPEMLSWLAGGKSVALVTDAGTPGASDPGMLLVRAARGASIRVEPVPGPSAVMAALSVTGDAFDRFRFMGFPPIRSKDRKRWLKDAASTSEMVVFFEAPHRVRKTLGDLTELSVTRPITVARELTKMHEEVVTGTAEELLALLVEPRGEYTLVMAPQLEGTELGVVTEPAKLDELVECVLSRSVETSQGSRRGRLRRVAEQLGVTTSEVYRAVERLKHRS